MHIRAIQGPWEAGKKRLQEQGGEVRQVVKIRGVCKLRMADEGESEFTTDRRDVNTSSQWQVERVWTVSKHLSHLKYSFDADRSKHLPTNIYVH